MEGRDKLKRKTLANRLDDDSVEDVLINLPVKSLMRFKCVSKTWQSFIEDPSFVQLHLNRSKQHPQLLIATSEGDSIKVISPKEGFQGGVAHHLVTVPWAQAAMLCSIDGLFCFVDSENAVTRIYNLGTRQVTPWAQTSIPIQGGFGVTQMPTYGFGFDPLTNKYKILCVWEISRPGYEYALGRVEHICEVFTVGENKWRRIDDVPPVRSNGSIYSRNGGSNVFRPPDNEVIVAFDVGTEKLRVIQVPDYIAAGRRTKNLLQIDGHMALMDRVDRYVVKLWISDDSYKEKKMTANWTEESISLPSSFLEGHCLDLAPVEGTDEIVIQSHVPSSELIPRGFISLYIYNRTMKSFREIEITGISPLLRSPYYYGVFIFHESLLPVRDPEKKLVRPTPMDCS